MRSVHWCVATTIVGTSNDSGYKQIIEATHSSSQRRSVGSAILLLLPIADQV